MNLLALLFTVLTGTAFACPSGLGLRGADRRELQGRSNQLDLIQKRVDENGFYTIPVEDGPHGRMRYGTSGPRFDYTFTGHDLAHDEAYELVILFDGTNEVTCLGKGKATKDGNLNIGGRIETGNLSEVQVWLGPAKFFDCSMGVLRSPKFDEFLFEEQLLTYDPTANVH